MLARSAEVNCYLEAATLRRHREGIITAVLTDKPRSMKYRGTGWRYKAKSEHSAGSIVYETMWDPRGIDAIFADWYRRHACK